jgi:hypothetical protein
MPSRSDSKKRNRTAAFTENHASTEETQAAKRVKNEESEPAVESGSSKKQERERRVSGLIAVDATPVQTPKKSKKDLQKEKGKKEKTSSKAPRDSEENGTIEAEKPATVNAKTQDNSETHTNNVDDSTIEPFVCTHNGHAPDQCWHLHPERKSEIITKKNEHAARKREKRKEKDRADLKKKLEKQRAQREAAKTAGISLKELKEKEKGPAKKKLTKKMRRFAKQVAAAELKVKAVEEEEEMADEKDASASKGRPHTGAGKSGWLSSKPSGGRFLRQDPVFSLDEK